MADILIKGLALPKNYPYRLSIEADGTVTEHTIGAKATAIELPSHGRLVDKDAILDAYNKELYYWQESPQTAHDELVHIVNNAPTIVEANYGSDN